MSDILCVTNRRLCGADFLTRTAEIAAAHPAGIILREKDLSEGAYAGLAAQVMEICRANGVPCILHSFVEAALACRAGAIHLPLPILRTLPPAQKRRFSRIGASCHSVEEALEAQSLGCTYLTAGHIFDTDCKKGTPGRGLPFLEAVCRASAVPVYAIGGVDAGRIGAVRRAGAAGACLMSSLMTCTDVRALLSGLEPV